MPCLHHVQHPILLDRITRMRDRRTDQRLFVRLLEEASLVLALEATRDLALRPTPVVTPLEETQGVVLADAVVLVPILRSGLGMLPPFRTLLPQAAVSFVGALRNEETLEPSVYLDRVASVTPDACIFLLDPMLATGGTAATILTLLKERGANRLRLVCCLASPEGIRRVREAHPDTVIYTGAIDRGLDARGFLLPGLGDAGDRQFGACPSWRHAPEQER
ncbi:uracil phosphoribosyltransferase [Methylacidimicrobium sp. B4]|uniref:uracil phosphoribosyltransferase n=1 Tax=Methylacidimicrobium sp. B4 TaxID=2796139 RepID=UPI001A9083B5|nr:uracil phosphoribosyltransferase [Methylacidimicrobium sp. B4]QSR85077.1 uracil phosphoribosyltransferase [Methylacidimicrobium sp. B4]